MRYVSRALACALVAGTVAWGAPPSHGVTAVAQTMSLLFTYSPGLDTVPKPVTFSATSALVMEAGIVDNSPALFSTSSCTASGSSTTLATLLHFEAAGTWTCSGNGNTSGQLLVFQSGGYAMLVWTGVRTIAQECVVVPHTVPPLPLTSATLTCVGPAVAP